MIPRHIRFRLARSAAYGVVAAGLVFLACETEAPQALSDGGGPGESSVTSAQAAQVFDESVLDQVPERLSCPVPAYPALMREARIEGQVLVQFVVETDGTVESSTVEVLNSSHRAFEAPAKDMIARCRFRPGQVDGHPVRTLVQMPIMFRLGASEAQPRQAPPTGGQAPINITASAAPSAMRGTVYDPTGKPVAGARVLIVGTSSSAVTDAQGAYSLAVPMGTYSVRAEFDGFQPTEMAGVKIRAGETLTADFMLAERPRK